MMTSIFGNSPQVKLIDLLLIGRGLEYSISDMAEHAGIGRSSVYRMLDKLIKKKIIVQTRKIGRIRLYDINEQNEKVKKLIKFVDSIAKHNTDQEIKRQAMKIKQVH